MNTKRAQLLLMKPQEKLLAKAKGTSLHQNYPMNRLKEYIAKKCNVSLKRVEQAITEFVKKGIMRRLGVGTYQFNPSLFGKGEWSDIYNIRAVFDFGTGEAVAQIIKKEEEKIDEATEKIDTDSKELLEKIQNFANGA